METQAPGQASLRHSLLPSHMARTQPSSLPSTREAQLNRMKDLLKKRWTREGLDLAFSPVTLWIFSYCAPAANLAEKNQKCQGQLYGRSVMLSVLEILQRQVARVNLQHPQLPFSHDSKAAGLQKRVQAWGSLVRRWIHTCFKSRLYNFSFCFAKTALDRLLTQSIQQTGQ